MTKKFTSVEEYITSFPEKTRKALEEVRAIIITPSVQDSLLGNESEMINEDREKGDPLDLLVRDDALGDDRLS